MLGENPPVIRKAQDWTEEELREGVLPDTVQAMIGGWNREKGQPPVNEVYGVALGLIHSLGDRDLREDAVHSILSAAVNIVVLPHV